MRKFLNRLAIVSLIGLPIAGAVATVPASASTGIHVRFVVTTAARPLAHPLAVPKSKIEGQGKTATFHPTALTVAEDTSGNDCVGDNFTSFKLKNTGTATAWVTFNGELLGGLPKGETGGICVYNGAAGDQATVGLTNKADTKTYASTLTITLSD